MPCVFWGDLLGTPETGDLPAVRELPILMGVRFRAAIGPQHSAFDDPDVVGFAREGRADVPGTGCAVILSDRRAAQKTLSVGAHHAGEEWECLIGGHPPVRGPEAYTEWIGAGVRRSLPATSRAGSSLQQVRSTLRRARPAGPRMSPRCVLSGFARRNGETTDLARRCHT